MCALETSEPRGAFGVRLGLRVRVSGSWAGSPQNQEEDSQPAQTPEAAIAGKPRLGVGPKGPGASASPRVGKAGPGRRRRGISVASCHARAAASGAADASIFRVSDCRAINLRVVRTQVRPTLDGRYIPGRVCVPWTGYTNHASRGRAWKAGIRLHEHTAAIEAQI